jgi:hypothetical protein
VSGKGQIQGSVLRNGTLVKLDLGVRSEVETPQSASRKAKPGICPEGAELLGKFSTDVRREVL